MEEVPEHTHPVPAWGWLVMLFSPLAPFVLLWGLGNAVLLPVRLALRWGQRGEAGEEVEEAAPVVRYRRRR